MGRVREESVRRKRIKAHEKVEKSRGTEIFQFCLGSRGSKSRLAEVVGAAPSGQMRDPKLHTGAARSTFRSENATNTTGSDHF